MSGSPELSPEQRRAALARALEARREHAAVVAEMRAGRLDLAGALADERARRARVGQLVRALPGVGPALAERIMTCAGIGDGKRVAGLGDRQRAALLAAAGDGR